MRRRRLLGALGSAVTAGFGGCIVRRTVPETRLVVSSPAFGDGGQLPTRFTCRGAGVSPPLRIRSVPDPTAALAVVAEADLGVFSQPTFWALWNVPADADRIPESLPRTATVGALGGARQASPGDLPPGYVPPCPPRGRTTTLRFDVVALEERVGVSPGVPTETAVEAINRALLSSSRITVEYTRPVDPTPQG